MKGQISIDYAAGALLFFLALVFIITGILSTVPQYSENIDENRLEMTAWKLTTAMLNTPGYWQNSTRGGTDWSRAASEDVRQVGFTAQEGDLSRAKLQKALRMDYSDIRDRLDTETHFRFDVREFAQVDTSRSYEHDDPPSHLPGFAVPAAGDYQEFNGTVQYGSSEINGEVMRWLVTQNETFVRVYWSNSWDFSTAGPYSSDSTQRLNFGEGSGDDRTYIFDGGDAGVMESDGELIVLQRPVGYYGRRMPAFVQDSVTVTRFSNIGSSPVRLEMEVWYQ